MLLSLGSECPGAAVAPPRANRPLCGTVCLSRRSVTKPDGRVARRQKFYLRTLDCYRSRRFFYYAVLVCHLVPCCDCSFGRVQSYTPSLCILQNTTWLHDNPHNTASARLPLFASAVCLSRRSVTKPDLSRRSNAEADGRVAVGYRACAFRFFAV